MTDFETRLREALVDGVGDAPVGTGLADAARTRARRRRRTTLVGAVAAVVLAAVAVPVGLATLGGDDEAAPVVVDPNRPADAGWRTETWHQATIKVPPDWGYGFLEDRSCGARSQPVVDRPGPRPRNPQDCISAISLYGVSFRAAGKDAYTAPHQVSGSLPRGAWVGEQTVAGVRVTVRTPSRELAQRILDSMRVVGNVDPNGCNVVSGFPVTVPDTGMAVCRYDDQGLLEQSEVLSAAEAEAAWRAVTAAPPIDGDARGGCFFMPGPDSAGGGRSRTVTMTDIGGTATVTLGTRCFNGDRVEVAGTTRRLTHAVRRWAESPGYDSTQ